MRDSLTKIADAWSSIFQKAARFFEKQKNMKMIQNVLHGVADTLKVIGNIVGFFAKGGVLGVIGGAFAM